VARKTTKTLWISTLGCSKRAYSESLSAASLTHSRLVYLRKSDAPSTPARSPSREKGIGSIMESGTCSSLRTSNSNIDPYQRHVTGRQSLKLYLINSLIAPPAGTGGDVIGKRRGNETERIQGDQLKRHGNATPPSKRPSSHRRQQRRSRPSSSCSRRGQRFMPSFCPASVGANNVHT
jgi:hypothetical protein